MNPTHIPFFRSAICAAAVLGFAAVQAQANPLLVGAPGIVTVRSFDDDDDINVVPPGTTLVTTGSHGTIDDLTLDGGTSSSHGFATSASLPAGSERILQINGNSSQIVAFSYPLVDGAVYYSTIPLDYYLDGNGPTPPQAEITTIYAPNVLEYMAGPNTRTVGYWTDPSGGNTTPEGPINQAGFAPVEISDITTFDFSTVDMLMVNNSSNGGVSAELLARLGDIEAWVKTGGKFIVHDRYVGDFGTGDPVPDAGATAGIFALGLAGIAALRRRLS